MSGNKGGPLYGIGGVTLLTVLLVLCLTLFSVLAISSAQADFRLSQKHAAAVLAYYEAEGKAYEVMKLAETIWPSGSPQPSLSDFSDRLYAEYEAYVEQDGDGFMIYAEVLLENSQLLLLTLHLGPGRNQARWQVIQWLLLPPDQYIGDIAGLPLWMPEMS
jgi:hypothetical protein